MQTSQMYLARIVQSKWRVGREVIPELIFINTLGKQSCAGKERMHTAPETWSGSSKATEGLGCCNDVHQSLPCQNRGLPSSSLSPILSTPISCEAGEY